MYFTDKTIVFSDGAFVNVSDAHVSPYSQTFHYGLGVFEGIRAYNTPNGVTIFKGKEHFERLLYSTNKMQIQNNYTVDELLKITYDLLDKNNLKSAYIRPVFYMGANMTLLSSEESHLFIGVWEWGKYLGDKLLDVYISSFQRPNPKSCHIDTKTTGHYINSILARNEAVKAGFDEALLLDVEGFLAEGTGENIFFEKDKKLFTPSLGNILPGITRATVMEIAKKHGIEVNEGKYVVEDLLNADAAFCTGTAIEVEGVKKVNEKVFPITWEDSIGYFLSKKYTEYINN